MGFFGAVASIWFVSVALISRSQPVELLDRAGAAANRTLGVSSSARRSPAGSTWCRATYGTAILAGGLVALYVPTVTFFAWRVGRVVERRTLERQRSDGAWRGELASMLNRVGLVAASRGQVAQRATNARLYAGIDRAWRRQNVWVATMLMFTEVSTFLSQRLLAYLPALPAFMAGGMSFRAYVASSELTAELIGGASWFTNVMPEIAVLRANATPADRARRGDRAGARPRPLLRRDRHQQLQAARDHRRADAGDRGAGALPSRARRPSVRHRAAARPAPGRPAPRQRAERLRQELAAQGGRGPLAVRRGPAWRWPRARGCSWPRRRPTCPSA